MAMEKQYVVRDTHTRSITAVGYNPVRREILLGFEDGVIKSWEAESGRLIQTFYEHKGWVTDFIFWTDAKVMFSSANDAQIVAWSSGSVADTMNVVLPVYCMAIHLRRQQLMCGSNGGVRVYALDKEKECGHYIKSRILQFSREHTDIVRCILCHESRVYTAGYDQRLVIYESSSYSRNHSLTAVFKNVIHDAGIACMVLAKHNENNIWLLTGSFDKTLKIWSLDGKLIHKLDVFLDTVSGICYIPRIRTVWAAAGTYYAYMFDPKSGDNVSDFIGTFSEQEEEKYHLQIIKFFPEINQVIASSNRSHLLVWKYNPSGCVTTLHCKSQVESLCYTSKIPVLIFSGDQDGAIVKWERMQSNHFMYSKETFTPTDLKMKKKIHVGSKARQLLLEQQQILQEMKHQKAQPGGNAKTAKSHYSFSKSATVPNSSHLHPNTAILKMIFVESMDLLLAASEDNNIYVWGFDDTAVEVLQNMNPQEDDILTQKYAVLLDPDSGLLHKQKKLTVDTDSVTNRVAGFILKYVLSEHLSCVTSLVLVSRDHGVDGTFVLSAGWDRRVCLWDLEAGQLKDTCKIDPNSSTFVNELASDEIITDMDFSPENMEFAYSCADKMVYIRKFSTTGSKMTLANTLQGHEAEVTCVRWNHICHKWVTGSDDGTIRIWSSHGMNECEQILSTQGGVTSLCFDKNHGSIVAGVQHQIKIFDAEHYRLVQSNVGHQDSVRSIIHIPERNQYVSCSWDATVRIWNAWKLPRQKKQTSHHVTEKRI